MGDNVVWQVDSLYDYEQFVLPFANSAMKEGRRLVYIRFATHEPLLAPHQYSVLYELDAQRGFELFTTTLHAIIARKGRRCSTCSTACPTCSPPGPRT